MKCRFVLCLGLLTGLQALEAGAAPAAEKVADPALGNTNAPALAPAGAIVVSIERLFGLHFSEAVQQQAEGGDSGQQWFGLGRGWSGGGNLAIPYEARRFSVDVFVFEQWSAGGGVAFAYRALDEREYWEVLAAPRIGYMLELSPQTGLWLRAGPHYHRSNFIEAAEGGWGVGAEAAGCVMFSERLGFTLTPAYDQSLNVRRAGRERQYRSISLTVGLMARVD